MFDFKKPLSPLLIVCISLLIPIIPFAIIGELPGASWLSNNDGNAFWFGLSGASLLSADVLLPIPSTIVGTMLGARLGFLSGFFWCWSGLILGNLIGYYLGRVILSRNTEAIPQSPTLLVLAISRPIPVLAEAVTFTAGAGGVKLPGFLFVSVFANAVFAAALAGNGATLLADNLLGPGLILPMLLPVAGWLIWQLRFKEKDQ